jgi:hypothetical protein
MKNILLIILITISVVSCKRESVSYTINGQFLSCTAYNNTDNYELFQQKNGSNVNAQILATTKTDANGNFSFTYTTNNMNDKLILRQSSGFGYSKILEEIDLGNISNLIIGKPIYHLIVSLNVTKPYTSNDTLFMANYNSNGSPIGFVKVAGPFISGRKFTFPNLYSGTSISEPKYPGTLKTYYCLLNTPFGTTGAFDKDYIVPLPKSCNGDSIFVSLDIK